MINENAFGADEDFVFKHSVALLVREVLKDRAASKILKAEKLLEVNYNLGADKPSEVYVEKNNYCACTT